MTDRCPECHECKELLPLPACEGVACEECLTEHLTECYDCAAEMRHQEWLAYFSAC